MGDDMNYYEKIQNSLDYIENNLKNEISLDILAEKSFLSKYYFHRVFAALTGETVMTYIRKRRLGLAIKEMNKTDKTLLEIALDSGFDSAEVFTRAFKKHFEISPSRYRKLKKKIDLTEKISFVGYSKKQADISPKIIVQDKKRLMGIYFKTNIAENMEKLTIANFHTEVFDKKIDTLKFIKNKKLKYGICEGDLDTGEILHFAAVEIDENQIIPEGMVERILPYSRYVVFHHNGPISDIQNSYGYIYKEWLPCSGYELSKIGRDMQIYYKRFKPTDKNIEMDIFVPIE